MLRACSTATRGWLEERCEPASVKEKFVVRLECEKNRLSLLHFSQTPERRSSRRRCGCAVRQKSICFLRAHCGFCHATGATYETVHAPPATVFLQDLQFQMPTA